MSDTPNNLENKIELPDYEKANQKQLPNSFLFNVEFPGYIKNLNKCLDTLGGVEKLTKSFLNHDTFDLRYRPQDPLSHPISGDNIDTRNFLLKVTRRVRIKKKKNNSVPNSHSNGTTPSEEDFDQGETLRVEGEVVGLINNTLKFRSLADFQYICSRNHPAIPLTKSIISGETEQLITQGKLWLQSPQSALSLPLIPPPIFSRTENYFDYKFQQAPSLRKVMIKSSDGSGYDVKYQNMRKSTKILMLVRKFEDNNIPLGPSPQLQSHRASIPKTLLEKAQKLFEERPVWARHSFISNIPNQKRIVYERLLPQVAYLMSNGPWRDCWIRYGYNPKNDIDARFYQMVDIRSITSQRQITRAKRRLAVEPREPVEKEQQEAHQTDFSHVFESATTTLRSQYQYSDVVHPRVRRYIDSPVGLRKVCDETSGWYHKAIMYKIRKLVKSILESPSENLHHDDTDEEILVKKWDYDKMRYQQSQKPSSSKPRTASVATSNVGTPSSQSIPVAIRDIPTVTDTESNLFDAPPHVMIGSNIDQMMDQLHLNTTGSPFNMNFEDYEDGEQYANVFGFDSDDDGDYDISNRNNNYPNDDDDDEDDEDDTAMDIDV